MKAASPSKAYCRVPDVTGCRARPASSISRESRSARNRADHEGVMQTTSAAIALFREYQIGLAQYGDVPYTRDLFFALTEAIGISLVEPEKLEAALERLHVRAYPEANRPPRLHIAGQLQDVLEDAPGFRRRR